jgi:hypothetical protein
MTVNSQEDVVVDTIASREEAKSKYRLSPSAELMIGATFEEVAHVVVHVRQ